MRRERKLCAAVSVIGLVLLLGTAGASDNNSISLAQTVSRSIIGLAMFASGTYCGGWIS